MSYKGQVKLITPLYVSAQNLKRRDVNMGRVTFSPHFQHPQLDVPTTPTADSRWAVLRTAIADSAKSLLQGLKQGENWKENGLGPTLRVSVERPTAEGHLQTAAEPFSPSKRFNIGCASFPAASQPEAPASDGNSDR